MNLYKEEKFLGLGRGWYVVGCAALFYAYQFILRVAPNVMNDELLRDLGINATELGTMISFYSWSYAGIQIPLGIVMDRFGAGRLLTLSALICGVSCFAFALTTSLFVCSLSLFLMGLGSACAFLGAMKLSTTWFPPSHLARAVALILVFGTLGASIGNTPLSVLVDSVGWQSAMHLFGYVGIGLAAIIYLVIGRHPEIVVYESSVNIFSGLKVVLSNPQSWLIACFGMLMYAPITIMGTAWGIPFIKVAYHMDEKIAATVTTVMFVGAALGSPVFSLFSDHQQSRITPMFTGAILCTAIYCIIIFIPNLPVSTIYALFFAAGFCYTAKSLSFSAICEITPPAYSGVGVGFVNTITMGTGIIFHPIIGKMIVYHWDGTIIDGVNFYSEWDYRFALALVPFSLAISVIICRFIRETHHTQTLTKSQQSAAILSDLE